MFYPHLHQQFSGLFLLLQGPRMLRRRRRRLRGRRLRLGRARRQHRGRRQGLELRRRRGGRGGGEPREKHGGNVYGNPKDPKNMELPTRYNGLRAKWKISREMGDPQQRTWAVRSSPSHDKLGNSWEFTPCRENSGDLSDFGQLGALGCATNLGSLATKNNRNDFIRKTGHAPALLRLNLYNLEKALTCFWRLSVGHAWLHFSAKINDQMMTPFQ